MAYSPQPARNNGHLSPNDALTFPRGQPDPESPLMLAFPTIPPGIYSTCPAGSPAGTHSPTSPALLPDPCNEGIPPQSTGVPLFSLEECQTHASDRRGGNAVEPRTWYNFAAPFDQPLQERVDSGPNTPNGDLRMYQHPMSRTPSSQGPRYALSVPSPRHARPALTGLTANVSSPHDTPLLCKWDGCESTTYFRREADLWRHIRTIHISPRAYPCPEKKCLRAFGRKDHLDQHTRRRHCLG
ncbi:hypothetical protein BDW62DRAFT_167153 [Aspergillus aurantiobrunneus]